jgi:hypothetical protein
LKKLGFDVSVQISPFSFSMLFFSSLSLLTFVVRCLLPGPQLRHEYKVYRELSGSVGIGRVHHYGTYGSSNVMVMDLLGASLEDLFTRCGRRFSLKTTLKLADQLLERVDAVILVAASTPNYHF